MTHQTAWRNGEDHLQLRLDGVDLPKERGDGMQRCRGAALRDGDLGALRIDGSEAAPDRPVGNFGQKPGWRDGDTTPLSLSGDQLERERHLAGRRFHGTALLPSDTQPFSFDGSTVDMEAGGGRAQSRRQQLSPSKLDGTSSSSHAHPFAWEDSDLPQHPDELRTRNGRWREGDTMGFKIDGAPTSSKPPMDPRSKFSQLAREYRMGDHLSVGIDGSHKPPGPPPSSSPKWRLGDKSPNWPPVPLRQLRHEQRSELGDTADFRKVGTDVTDDPAFRIRVPEGPKIVPPEMSSMDSQGLHQGGHLGAGHFARVGVDPDAFFRKCKGLNAEQSSSVPSASPCVARRNGIGIRSVEGNSMYGCK